ALGRSQHAADAQAQRFLDRRIKRAETDHPSNCHGWVFTGGRYFVSPEDVEKILKENDYELVRRPEAGDLIMYRDAEGKLVHSGIVRFVDGDFVLLESQWGTNGRYLHEPAEPQYSPSFEYYRSARRGHLIHLVDDPVH